MDRWTLLAVIVFVGLLSWVIYLATISRPA
jgi:hypothetical protein